MNQKLKNKHDLKRKSSDKIELKVIKGIIKVLFMLIFRIIQLK